MHYYIDDCVHNIDRHHSCCSPGSNHNIVHHRLSCCTINSDHSTVQHYCNLAATLRIPDCNYSSSRSCFGSIIDTADSDRSCNPNNTDPDCTVDRHTGFSCYIPVAADYNLDSPFSVLH